ncbi:hypothetical protein DXG01_016210 [Tephrocybe rancida]|nr:hypothetical protein DXG01_016210 [Tephrocybe rancida]
MQSFPTLAPTPFPGLSTRLSHFIHPSYTTSACQDDARTEATDVAAPVVPRSCCYSPNRHRACYLKVKAAAATVTYAPTPASTSKGTRAQAESAIPSDPFEMPPSIATAKLPKAEAATAPAPAPAHPHRCTFSCPSTTTTTTRTLSALPHHRPANTLLPAFEFPACDDLSDTDNAAPPTPIRRRRPRRRPAPTLPPVTSTAPQPQSKRARNHKRAPSDSGMPFSMSSDDSSSEHPHSHASFVSSRLYHPAPGPLLP